MPKRRRLGELLEEAGLIDQAQLGIALANQRDFGGPLGKSLVDMGFITEEAMIRTLARQLKLPVAWLDGKWVEPQVLELVPAELAHKHGCLPLALTEGASGKVLQLAMQDPGNLEALDAVSFQVGHKVSPVLAASGELEEALYRHYEGGGPLDAAASTRPEVQEVPEMLTFEAKAATPGNDPDFDLGATSGEAARVSALNKLRELTQLLSESMRLGVISREEVAGAVEEMLSSGEDEVLVLEDEPLSR